MTLAGRVVKESQRFLDWLDGQHYLTAGEVPREGGKTDLAVFRSSTSTWYVNPSSGTGWYSFAFGTSGDVPTPADFDGDGKVDIAIWRTHTWLIRQSATATTRTEYWGTSGDIPVPAYYRR